MHTNRLGVIEKSVGSNSSVDTTDLERTLIDLAVRPAYGGGPAAVLECYRNARGKASTSRIADLLRELDYVYPYHQAIGFYLTTAGYATRDIKPLKKFRNRFDFYLAHEM